MSTAAGEAEVVFRANSEAVRQLRVNQTEKLHQVCRGNSHQTKGTTVLLLIGSM